MDAGRSPSEESLFVSMKNGGRDETSEERESICRLIYPFARRAPRASRHFSVSAPDDDADDDDLFNPGRRAGVPAPLHLPLFLRQSFSSRGEAEEEASPWPVAVAAFVGGLGLIREWPRATDAAAAGHAGQAGHAGRGGNGS